MNIKEKISDSVLVKRSEYRYATCVFCQSRENIMSVSGKGQFGFVFEICPKCIEIMDVKSKE